MFKKLSQYTLEIVVGIAIFVAVIYFLPGNNITIPTIEDLQLSGVELNFVVEDADTPADTGAVTGDVVTETGVILGPVAISGMMFTGDVASFIQEQILPTLPPAPVVENDPLVSYMNCMSPRGTNVAHGDSIIVYQQRSDDPGTCNIQRRVCNNGILNGSYTQQSCKEYFGYDTKKEQVISYNISQPNTFIQPSHQQNIQDGNNTTIGFINDNSYINVNNGPIHGQVGFVNDNSYVTPNTPSNGTVGFSNGATSSSSSSTSRDGTTCTTPRGTEVRNGQFVKAYKVNNGFTNLPCEVELRYCVQQNLQGSFQFQSCTHNDIAVEDFLDHYFDPNRPSLMQLVETLYGYSHTPYFQTEYNTTIDLDRLFNLLDGLR